MISASPAMKFSSRLSSGSAGSVMCSSSIASLRAIIIVTLASSTANGLMSMPKNCSAVTKPNTYCFCLAALREFVHALEDPRFQPLQLAVGEVEEVAAAAGRVEHAELVHAVPGGR